MNNKVTYEFYVANGGTQPEDAFYGSVKKAVSFVRYITHGAGDGTTEAEKLAVCAVADIFANRKSEIEQGRRMVSESNDGWSVAYGTSANNAKDDVYASAMRVAKMHLAGTGLLSRRVTLL